MGVISDICRKTTSLKSQQIMHLENQAKLMGIAADLAHAQITIYAKRTLTSILSLLRRCGPTRVLSNIAPIF